LANEKQSVTKDFDEVSRQRDEYVHRLEKLGNQKEDLEIKYQSVKEERKTLNETISRLKQEVAILMSDKDSTQQQMIEENNHNKDMVFEFTRSFEQLLKFIPLGNETNVELQDKSQIAQAVEQIKENILIKDSKISRLQEEKETLESTKKEVESSMKNLVEESERRLQETTAQILKEKNDLQQSLKEDMEQRLLNICKEIEDMLKNNDIEISPVDEDIKERNELLDAEKNIYSHIISLRIYLENTSQSQQEYHK